MATTSHIKVLMSLQYSQFELGAMKANAATNKLDMSNKALAQSSAGLVSNIGSLGYSLGGIDSSAMKAVAGVLKLSNVFMVLEAGASRAQFAMVGAFAGLGLGVTAIMSAVEAYKKVQETIDKTKGIVKAPTAVEKRGAADELKTHTTGYQDAAEDLKELNKQYAEMDAQLVKLQKTSQMSTAGDFGFGQRQREEAKAAINALWDRMEAVLKQRRALESRMTPEGEIADVRRREREEAYAREWESRQQRDVDLEKQALAERSTAFDIYFANMENGLAVLDAFEDKQKALAVQGKAIADEINPDKVLVRSIKEIGNLVALRFLSEGDAAKKIQGMIAGFAMDTGRQGTAAVFGPQSRMTPMASRDNIPQTLLNQLEATKQGNTLLGRLLDKAGLAS
jgi:hypothetical protein